MGDRGSARTERLEQLHAQLTAAVEDLANSDAWRRMLEVAARMPSDSPSNVLLIAMQRPDATSVAGYATWRSLGRQVRKSEKGIARVGDWAAATTSSSRTLRSTDPGSTGSRPSSPRCATSRSTAPLTTATASKPA